ncbi:MAG: type VII toxin-antitoxin system MntA family adenylyltransferase antitoxin [Polyangiaceae bacterium]
MTREEIAARLRPALEGRGLRMAVLFGSAARDALRGDSDVDVAILPASNEMPLAEELALQAALERLAGRTVDLVRLDRSSVLVRWRVAREGVPLLAEPAREWPRFVAQAGIEHGDFAPTYAQAAERFRRRLAAGGGPR